MIKKVALARLPENPFRNLLGPDGRSAIRKKVEDGLQDTDLDTTIDEIGPGENPLLNSGDWMLLKKAGIETVRDIVLHTEAELRQKGITGRRLTNVRHAIWPFTFRLEQQSWEKRSDRKHPEYAWLNKVVWPLRRQRNEAELHGALFNKALKTLRPAAQMYYTVREVRKVNGEKSIAELEIGAQVRHALKKFPIKTIGELARKRKATLVKHLGEKAAHEIELALIPMGF